ncbi:hypothetical protein BC827DRAFT_1301881 [Russula dissimulans]|nr:hypothetical protein BC827DRAFT_1301881 [Russula dissimulans]
MAVSRFFVGLLLIASANAFWRLPCTKPVLDARVDPIVNPGKASGHTHTIMGSGAIGFSTTFADLRNSDCTTCKVKDDKSAYWIPELYYQYKNESFQAVSHGGMLVYYLQRGAANETVQAFPDGLRVLAGNPFLRSYTDTPEAEAISWNCINFNAAPVPQTPGFANTNCPSGLRAQVFFPSCWDGVNLDSPDHKSHMAYPDGVDNGQCPPSHPIHLISIFFEVYFNVAPFNNLNDGGRFVLANGDPTGYGLHGDFMNGWDRGVLSRAVTTCTATSGVIEDCPVFQNEGRLYTDDENNACSATNPLPDENVAPGTLLQYLPGCVAVTEGPAPATPANVVEGCVTGNGSGSTVPVMSPYPVPTVPLETPSNPVPSNVNVTTPASSSSQTFHSSSGSTPVVHSPSTTYLGSMTMPAQSNVPVPTPSSETSNSPSSFPVTPAQPTTQLGPMTTLGPLPSNATVPASFTKAYHSPDSIPVTYAHPTTPLGPMTSQVLASSSSTCDEGSHTPIPHSFSGQALQSSNEVYAIPTSVLPPPPPSTHTMESASTPKASSAAEYLPSAVPTKNPVPFPLSGHHEYKPHHHYRPGHSYDHLHHHHHHGPGYGHHEQHHGAEGEHVNEDEDCDEDVPQSHHPGERTKVVLPHRRRHHLTGGHGSRMFI